MIVAGCDVGSLTAEAVVMDGGSILGSEIIRVRPKAELSAREVMDRLLGRLGLPFDDIAFCVSTGYGRETISFADDNVSEISCHGYGAHWLVPSIRTVIDVGGQDCKAIRVDDQGRLADFVMNDKCAAGTGRSLELMSESLGVDVSELGPLAEGARQPAVITNQCSIFAEMEISQFLCEERSFADIAAGINESMARRVKALVGRIGVEE
jgi:predicted CoA-substrate-specific enzyme activase